MKTEKRPLKLRSLSNTDLLRELLCTECRLGKRVYKIDLKDERKQIIELLYRLGESPTDDMVNSITKM